MSAADRINLFEKAAKVKEPTPEEQRQRARFEARKNKFERKDSADNGKLPSKVGDVHRKANWFMEADVIEQKEKEAQLRKESFDKTRKGFLAIEEGQVDPVDLEKERQEVEEAEERRKQEFKNKAMIFNSI